MHWEHLAKQSAGTESRLTDKKISETAKEIYGALGNLPATQEEIVARLRKNGCTLTVPQICQGLVELELTGLASSRNRQYKQLSASAK